MTILRVLLAAAFVWCSLPAVVCGAICSDGAVVSGEAAEPPCHGANPGDASGLAPPRTAADDDPAHTCPACESTELTGVRTGSEFSQPLARAIVAPQAEFCAPRPFSARPERRALAPPRAAHIETNAPLLI